MAKTTTDEKPVKFYYQETHIDQVYKHYANGYKIPEGKTVKKYEVLHDHRTGKVIFKFHLEDTSPIQKPNDGVLVASRV